MRWNCPHCEVLVTAGIDFEVTKKAYVRCAKCNGIALIHRSQAFADSVKARRLEEEAQIESEENFREAAKNAANSKAEAETQAKREAEVRTNREADTRTHLEAPAPKIDRLPPPAPPRMLLEEANGFDPIVECTRLPPPMPTSDLPKFSHAQPPAFLMKHPPSAPQTFASTEFEEFQISDSTGFAAASAAELDAEFGAPTAFVPPVRKRGLSALLKSNFAVWIAAALALGSGIYLFMEGRRALHPQALTLPASPGQASTAAPQADLIVSKSNSALRASERRLVVVNVPRAVLRSKPSKEADTVQTVEQRAILGLIEEQDGWMHVESPKLTTSDRSAWVRADHVAHIPN